MRSPTVHHRIVLDTPWCSLTLRAMNDISLCQLQDSLFGRSSDGGGQAGFGLTFSIDAHAAKELSCTALISGALVGLIYAMSAPISITATTIGASGLLLSQ